MTSFAHTIFFIVLVGIMAFFVAGCEKQTKHELLTFFFTGVPPLEGEEAVIGDETVVAKKTRTKRPVPEVFIHGPKASGECFYCHNTDTTLSFQRVKKGGGMPRLGDITPGRLAVPMNQLCVQCHITKSSELRYTENLWVHGPLADGICTGCHDYHQSRYQYMLLMETSKALCTQCHSQGYIMQTEAHQGDEECIECHNPHVGANRLLLRKDFNEVF